MPCAIPKSPRASTRSKWHFSCSRALRISWKSPKNPRGCWGWTALTVDETDEFGFNVTKDGVHVHDLHATLLHLLGFDHTRLTYRFQGRDFRLTDVSGNIVEKMLA